MRAKLILEDGSVFEGKAIGAAKDFMCEVVFNTSMTGYNDILTDPSYAEQGVVMTYPIIGSYGISAEDAESSKPWLSALIVREQNRIPSNFRSQMSLGDYLVKNDIPGICGIDTRALTKHLRASGTMRGMGVLGDEEVNVKECVKKLKAYKCREMVETVSRKDVFKEVDGGKYDVALIDLGTKRSIARSLIVRGCNVTWYPANTSAETILAANPDGIMLSNGPGDPKSCTGIIKEIKKLCDSGLPVFGISLGHQLLALANGFDTYKLTYGHRGGNHPVKDVKNGRVYITSQNHGYCVDNESVDPEQAEITHYNVNDGSCEGLRYRKKKIFSVQFNPDTAVGSGDTSVLYDKFIKMMGGSDNA